MQINPDGFLWPEEEKLGHHIIKTQEDAFAWSESKKGQFNTDYFPPIHIPTVPHEPWIHKNIPIPPGILSEVIGIIKEKISAGTYEPSNSSYRSRWFCVLKKDGKSLRIVHDLQPLNAVTIRDPALPPLTEHLAEAFGGHSCYASFDLFVSFDQRLVHPSSRDYMTFQSPLGTLRLTRIAMGYTNSPQILHGDSTYILRDEIPHLAMPYIDDIPVKGPPTRYELPDGSYETIPENSGIRRFVWEHYHGISRVMQRFRYVGGTFNGKKLELCRPTVIVVGHKCTYEGRVPDESKVQKVRDWPMPKNLTEVRAFLGICGVLRIFIKDYSRHSRPLVRLTRKAIPFEFGDEEAAAVDYLKNAVITSSALRAIDYTREWEVILAVDSSVLGVGFVLMQIRDDGKRYPSRFGSISWNERESRYSQSKLELYGLFRALRAYRIFIIGVRNLTVEVDAKYIKGMLNNPDIQPNATINRWIAGVLLFDFRLVHVPATAHGAADGLSRRPPAPEDPQEPDDSDDWIDDSYGFFMELVNYRPVPTSPMPTAACYSCRSAGMRLQEIPSALVYTNLEDVSDIPRSDKAKAADARLTVVDQYLRNFIRPPNMTDEEFRQFLRYTFEFFVIDNKLWRKDRHGKHKLVIPPDRRLQLIKDAHDSLGHKGMFSVRSRLLDRFWWPHLEHDVKWYIQSCHQCQVRQMRYHHIPPTVATPASLFRKAYIDTMFMPRSGGFRYIVQARCSLSSYPEFRMLRRETGSTIGSFIFEEILCRWGALEEIVTDNGKPFVEALEYLATRYGIRHIRISAYNSQANGPIERRHLDVREAIMKSCDGDENKWHTVTHSIFWAERVTTHKNLGYSSYYIVHGVEPLFPFDLAEATYMVPTQDAMTTTDLIVLRARQLRRREADLDTVKERLTKSRFASARQFEQKYANTIKVFDFEPGNLVLVRNSRIEMSLDRKAKPRYFGPMVVVRKTKGGSYILAELDGAVSKTRYAAFRVIPYHARSNVSIPLDDFLQYPDTDESDTDESESDTDKLDPPPADTVADDN
jgi:hypothetical protein